MTRSRTFALAATLLSVLSACSGTQDASVPVTSLEDAEPLVRERIEQAVRAVRAAPESGAAWGRLGELYDAHRYITQAASCYERAQQLEPRQWRWPYFTGLVARDTDSAAAQRHLARALELEPGHAPAWFYRGLAALQAERIDDADEFFRRALEAEPQMVNALLGLARVALARGDPRVAVELAERAALAAPDEKAVHEQRAQIYRVLGEVERAAEAEEAARSAPIEPSVLGFASLSDPVREGMFLRVGVSTTWLLRRSEAGDAGPVVADLRRAIELDAGRIDLRLALARVLSREGRLEQARAEIERALEIDPRRAASHAQLGDLLVRSGRTAEAVRAYRRALEIDPDHHATRATLGGVLVQSGAMEEGIGMLRAAAQASPGDAHVQHNLAAGLARAGRPDEALAVAVELVAKRPRYTPGLTLLGTLRALRGELDESVTLLKKALEIDPQDATIRLELGRSLWESGRYAEAIEAFGRAAAERPDAPEMARELAWALATSPVAGTRDGRQAVEIAQQLCERSGFGNPMHLDVLAAAQAEAGDFQAAARTSSRALQIVEQTLADPGTGNETRVVLAEFAGELRDRLSLYRNGSPYRQKG